MPNTLIREGYLDSDRISELSDFDDRVFFRILLAADDAGRTDGRTDKLRSALFPTRLEVRGVDVEEAVKRLSEQKLVKTWQYDGKPVVQVLRWQRRSGAQYSKHPDEQGKFKIEWVEIETRDGKHMFASTSLNGLSNPSATHRQPIRGDSEKPTETDTKTETDTHTDGGDDAKLPTVADFKAAALTAGLPESEAVKCFHHYGKSGFKTRNNTLIHVGHCIGGWKSNWQERRQSERQAAQPVTPNI